MITQNIVMGIIIMGMQYNVQASVKGTAKEKASEYNCFRVESCDAHGDPVCGFDEQDETIAKFENECALFRVNCNGKGQSLFNIVDDYICEKKVVPKTSTPTTITSSTMDYYYDLRADTEPDTSTHYWQDSLMLGRRITRGGYGGGRGLREKNGVYYDPAMMTLLMRL